MTIFAPAARHIVHSLAMFATLFAFTVATSRQQTVHATQPAKQNEPTHDGKTIAQWAALLNSKNFEDYKHAVDALSHLAAQTQDAIPELVKALHVHNRALEYERVVVKGLVRVGSPVVPALSEELKKIDLHGIPPQGANTKETSLLGVSQSRRFLAIMLTLRKIGSDASDAANEVHRFEKSKLWKLQARDTLKVIQPSAANLVRRGIEAYSKGDYEKTVGLLSKAISMDKSNPTSKAQKQQKSRQFHWRGAAYAKIGNLDLAIADLNEAILLDPTKVSLYQIRAKVYDGKGDKKLAEADRTEAARLQDKTANAPPLPSFRTPIPVAPPAIKQESTISRIDYARKIAPHVVNNTSRTDFLKQYPNAKIAPAPADANYFAYEVVENQVTVFYLFHGEKVLAARRINNAGAILKKHDLSFKLLKEMEKKLGNPDDTEVTEEQHKAGVLMCCVWFIPDQQVMIIGSLGEELDVWLAPVLITEVVHWKNAESVNK